MINNNKLGFGVKLINIGGYINEKDYSIHVFLRFFLVISPRVYAFQNEPTGWGEGSSP